MQALVVDGHFYAKTTFNDTGAVFFDQKIQHHDLKATGLSYEHASAGNALAAILLPNKIDVRFHHQFSDEQAAHLRQE